MTEVEETRKQFAVQNNQLREALDASTKDLRTCAEAIFRLEQALKIAKEFIPAGWKRDEAENQINAILEGKNGSESDDQTKKD